jgi:hypothetical protein
MSVLLNSTTARNINELAVFLAFLKSLWLSSQRGVADSNLFRSTTYLQGLLETACRSFSGGGGFGG